LDSSPWAQYKSAKLKSMDDAMREQICTEHAVYTLKSIMKLSSELVGETLDLDLTALVNKI